jgi:hypothetical protein
MLRSRSAPLSALVAALALGCSAPPPQQPPQQPAERLAPRLAPGYPESIARGERIALPLAELFVPDGFTVPASGEVPLCVHFQGGVKAAEENFARMQRSGVLIASTLAGRSGAFAEPYRDPAAFRALLAAGEAELLRRCGRDVHFGPLLITFWSAGYGAVRELLRDPDLFARIDALVSADSIYATVVADDVRAPRIEDMVDFVRFAQAAARGEKTFVLAHGRYPTDYASTAETAQLLRSAVAAVHVPVTAVTERGVPIACESHQRGFHCYEFAEATAGIHVDCLYFVPELVRRHVQAPAQ